MGESAKSFSGWRRIRELRHRLVVSLPVPALSNSCTLFTYLLLLAYAQPSMKEFCSIAHLN